MEKEKKIPDAFAKVEKMSVEELLRKIYGIGPGRAISLGHFHYYRILSGNSLYDIGGDSRIVDLPAGISVLDENGEVWIADLGFSFTENTFGVEEISTTILRPRKKTGLIPKEYGRVFSAENAEEAVRKRLPHAYKMMKDNGWFAWDVLLSAPYMEQLASAGYRFAEDILKNYGPERWRIRKTESDMVNRLCHDGTSPQTIFTVPKCLFSKLKNERDLTTWDTVRKMQKDGISYEDAGAAYERFADTRDRSKMLPLVRKIMKAEYDGKRLFHSWKKLSAYFDRIDMYEAIGLSDGIILLSDYLDMCRKIGVRPKIDSDSLKREHDVTARIFLQRAKEAEKVNMEKASVKLRKYDYAEKAFFIRGIRDYDDLLNEAEQQRNCVASYAGSIASGRKFVYTMRETKHPEKALITVELGKDLQIRQAYLSCNRPITSLAQKTFLQRWLREIRRPGFKPSEIDADAEIAS